MSVRWSHSKCTFSGRSRVPRRPHLDGKERGPTHNICQHYDERHLDGGDLGFGDEPDTAHTRQRVAFGGLGRKTDALLAPGFQPKVLPDFEANETIAQAQDGHRDDVDGQTDRSR